MDTPPLGLVVDGTPIVTNDHLVITYGSELDPDSTPATDAYTVIADAIDREITAVVVSGRTVTLTLFGSVYQGTTVTLSYDVPEDDPIQDREGNPADELTNVDVENRSDPIVGPQRPVRPPPVVTPPADDTPPALDGIPSVFEDTLYIKYDEALDRTSTPATDAYGVTFNGTAVAVDDVEIRLSFVLLSLESESVCRADGAGVLRRAGGRPSAGRLREPSR